MTGVFVDVCVVLSRVPQGCLVLCDSFVGELLTSVTLIASKYLNFAARSCALAK